MKKNILIVFFSVFLIIIQSSLYFKTMRINLLLLFLVYLLFFEDINYSFMVVGSSLLLDIFAINFGAYFVSFLLVSILLYYIYHNFLGNNKLFTYLLLNFLAIIIFNLSYYFYNFFIKIINQGYYFLNWRDIFNYSLKIIFFNLFISLVLYILTNTFSYRIRKKFTIIRS